MIKYKYNNCQKETEINADDDQIINDKFDKIDKTDKTDKNDIQNITTKKKKVAKDKGRPFISKDLKITFD